MLVVGMAVAVFGTEGTARAAQPAEGQLLPNGSTVSGPCSEQVKQVHNDIQSWIVFTYDPERIKASSKGNDVIVPEPLPRIEALIFNPIVWSGPSLQGAGTPTEQAGCNVINVNSPDSSVSGNEVALNRPGPYVLEMVHSTSDWVQGDATPQPCAQNDPYMVGVVQGAPPPEPGWSASAYCNVVTVIHFNVANTVGSCPRSGDGSQFPVNAYLNQYDIGARLGLPPSYGQPGGNACGPSSLLMAMAKTIGDLTNLPNLPSMGTTYDRTMAYTRAQPPPPNVGNVFVGNPSAVSFLRSLGWLSAKTVGFGTDQGAIAGGNLVTLNTALGQGSPVVVSTAFGAGRWSRTGGGHMILVEKLVGSNYVVDDPAGNFFLGPTSHYGAGKCGYQVLYPVQWMASFITGRWLLELGPYTAGAALAPRSAAPFAAAATLPAISAYAVFDANPGASDNPQTFYLQDPQGRRAGWIDGVAVSEIPDSAVSQDPPSYTDSAIGENPPVSPLQPTPRSVVLTTPEPGTVLHVSATSGSPYALTANAWVAGAVTATDAITGVGTGQDAVTSSPALDTLTGGSGGTGAGGGSGSSGGSAGAGASTGAHPAPIVGVLRARRAGVSHRRIVLGLSCARARCSGAATLAVRIGRRTVIVERATFALAAGRRLKLKLNVTGAGAELMRSHRKLRALLTVSGNGHVALRGAAVV